MGILATIIGASVGILVGQKLPYKPWTLVASVVVLTMLANAFIPW